MTELPKGPSALAAGDILVENGTLLPDPLRLETCSTVRGWAPLADQRGGLQLKKELTAAGWTFFYMAGSITATAFGFKRENSIHAALKRLFTAVRFQGCNCLEIDSVAAHSLFGMPYVSISGHSRHIQKSITFAAQ